MATSTVTQTLPIFTQAVTGETTYFTLENTVEASEVLEVSVNLLFIETATASEQLYAIENQALTSTAESTGVPTFTVSIPVAESALASSQVNVNQTTLIPSSYVRVKSVLTAVQLTSYTDTVTAGDSQTTILSAFLQGSVYVSASVVTPGIIYNQLVSSAVSVSGDPIVFPLYELAETAQVSSTTTGYASVTELLSGTALALNSQITVNRHTAELEDAVLVESALSFEGSVYRYCLVGTVFVEDALWAKDFDAIAWVMNTETTGLSMYDNFQFTSITAHNGILYATSNGGVYALIGETDEGRNIDTQLKTGFLDFGRAETKRVSDIFVGYTGGQLTFDVEIYDVPGTIYTYIMEEREAGAPRNNRIKPGKGLSSRYWRFNVKNIDGADFQIYDVAPNIAASKRRL